MELLTAEAVVRGMEEEEFYQMCRNLFVKWQSNGEEMA